MTPFKIYFSKDELFNQNVIVRNKITGMEKKTDKRNKQQMFRVLTNL